jgi:hypothetical protein
MRLPRTGAAQQRKTPMAGEAPMYDVYFYEGNYRDRQLAANDDGCICYVEHHFNCVAAPEPDYALAVVGSNASATSKNWGRWYAEAVAARFGTRVGGDQGILVGGYNGRGNDNVRFTDMPAVLLEPMFVSNPRQAEIVRSAEGRRRLAEVLVESIQRFFPHGGTVAFSVGHKYKDSAPNDRGAAVLGGGTEADYAEMVLEAAAEMLVETEPREERLIYVERNGVVEHEFAIDADADLRWDPVRGRLIIDEHGAAAHG